MRPYSVPGRYDEPGAPVTKRGFASLQELTLDSLSQWSRRASLGLTLGLAGTVLYVY